MTYRTISFCCFLVLPLSVTEKIFNIKKSDDKPTICKPIVNIQLPSV